MEIASVKMLKIYWKITIATFMQPFQYSWRCSAQNTIVFIHCVLQPHVANPHLSTHMRTPHDNIHAAIPLRSATRQSTNLWDYVQTTSHSSHFTRKNTRFRAKLPPKTKPLQHPCSHYNPCRNIRSQPRISPRTWQRNRATFMQPFHGDLQQDQQGI